MIRTPLQTAFARSTTTTTRAAKTDLARVADGTPATIRSFSAAQRLAANTSDDNRSSASTSSSVSTATSKPTLNNRSRASAAVDGLINKAEQSVLNLRKIPSSPVPGRVGSPNVIRVTSLPGRGRGMGGAFASGPRNPPGPSGVTERPGVNYNYNDRQSRPPQNTPLNVGINVSGDNGQNSFRKFGGGGGGGGGGMTFRGGRPGRFGKSGRGKRGGDGGGRGEGRDGEGRDGERQDTRRLDPLFVTEEEAAYVARLEQGVEHTYDPTFNLDSLHGYAPAVATTSSPFGYAATAVASARVLGGGRPFEHENHVLPHDALASATKGTGVYFPSAESRAWTQEFSGAGAPDYSKGASGETRTAVLEAALQGKYDSPRPVALGDTLALVENYTKKDTRAFGQPARTIQEKIRSLLPQKAGTTGATKSQDTTASGNGSKIRDNKA